MKMIIKSYYLYLFLTFISANITAQNISIRGRVLNANDQSILPFASVELHKDSLFITGITTDSNGEFTFKNIMSGSYLLKISYLGFKSDIIRIEELNKPLDIGAIALKSESLDLSEVVVRANPVINKVDRQIILPTDYQIKASNNAFDLLNNMMISRLHVDPLFKIISVSGGGNVQTRINGVRASKEEITALQAKDIQRIEYIESPGAQYRNEDIDVVINIIVKRKEFGGIVAIEGLNAPFVKFGNENFSVKYNYKLSEWGLIYELSYRGAKERWRDLEESFYYPNGKNIKRTQDGIIAPLENNTHVLDLSYNLFKTDKYIFNAIIKNYFYSSPKDDWKSVVLSQELEKINTQTHQLEKQQTPSIDLYFQYMFSKNQSVSINSIGTYNISKYERTYKEYSGSDTLTNINTVVDGGKYSLITEGLYERLLGKQKFDAGIKYTQISSQNTYIGSESATTKMNQSEYYFFADLTGKLNPKLGYTLGSGLSRSWFSESGNDQLFYTFCPVLQLSYIINNYQNIRYRFSLKPSIPSLSSLSNIEQAIDSIQYTKGNPYLHPYKIYRNSISYSFSKKKLNSEIFVSYLFYDNPIMEDVSLENNRFVITNNNQVNWQKINIEATLGFAPLDLGNLKNFVMFNFSGGFSRFLSNGNDYSHQYNNFYYNINANFIYRKWILSGEFRTFQSNLFGERINYGENQQNLVLLFRPNNFTLGLGVLFPFSSTYKEGYERLNKIAPVKSWSYVNESSRMIFAKFSYDFSLGRQYKSEKRRINNQDDRDSGILKSDR